MNVIMRFICLFISAISTCVIAGQAMAFDLGGMMKEAQKAVQQQVPNNTIPQPAKQAAQPAVAQPAKQDSNSQKTTVATASNSNFAETSEPLELKGIKIGMTAQELLKLYPQAVLITVPPQTENWIYADQFVTFGDGNVGVRGIDCDKGHSINKTCTPVTIMGRMADKMVMVFVNNKLVDGSIKLIRDEDGVFYDTLLDGLSAKFMAKPTSKVSNTGPPANYVFRIAGWLNSSCKCHLTVIDDENVREGYIVKIELGTDEYNSVVEDRRKTFNALAEKAEAGKDAKAKKDM